jgi:formylglycine-generating enzyme required for sulfatase activity
MWVVCLFLLFCTTVAAQGAAAQRRTALVIGNAAYQDNPLLNPVHDATDMAATLKRLGFEVTLLRDADRRTMQEAIEAFSLQLRQGGVGLFYFAGHGVQVEGENYLIPLRTRINREQDVQYEAVPVGRILGGMENAANPLNIIILDACRDNPYKRSFRSSAPDGLAPIQAARGSLIAYATAPGKKAADGSGRNGVYTQRLLQAITTPGLSVEQVFKKVRIEVVKVMGDKQVPWESSSMTGDFYFVPPNVTTSSPAAVTGPPSVSSATGSPDPEAAMWAFVERSSDPEDLRDFLKAYPDGRFAPAARLKLKYIEGQQAGETKSPLSQPTTAKPPPPQPGGGTQVAGGADPPASQPEVPLPKTLRNSIGMEFVLIPAGEFQMGSNDGEQDENPVHRVRISKAFYLGTYEVTQGQWQAVMGNNPSYFRGDPNLPVDRAPWDDVQEFIHKLNAKEGSTKYRLPTEAEWEYAARAGSTTVYSFGNNSSQLGKYVWYDSNAESKTHPVGQKKPNAWGLYDMYGNVWEWVQDWYSSSYRPPYGLEIVTYDPKGPRSGSYRVRRGGGGSDVARYCRSANRNFSPPGYGGVFFGFRLLRTAP